MKKLLLFSFLSLVLLTNFLPAQQDKSNIWTKNFNVSKSNFKPYGKNPYFILEPGYQLKLNGKEEDVNVQLTITVLPKTKVIDGIKTSIVEERELHNNKLVEISENYFAIDKLTNSVYYFGEDVNIYKNNKVIGNDGSWLSGINGAHYGLMMPGIVLNGSSYYQEVAPEVAMDRAKVISTKLKVKTNVGLLKTCIKSEETTPLEPNAKEYKVYAPGIGLIKDGSLDIVYYKFVKN